MQRSALSCSVCDLQAAAEEEGGCPQGKAWGAAGCQPLDRQHRWCS